MAQPWFKLFPRDYLTDSKVRMLSREHRSMLLDLWCYCAMDGSIPADVEALARLLGEPVATMRKAMEKLACFFVHQNGALVSMRLQQEADAYEQKCQKLRESASKGGRSKAANAVANARANGTPDACQTLEQTLKQNPAETEAEAEKETTPPAPPRGEPKPRRRGKIPADDLGVQPPLEVLNAVGRIVELTPQVDSDGRKIRVVRSEVLIRVMRILAEHTSATPGILVQAWEAYLRTEPRMVKAPQYFFGRQEDQGDGAANWYPYAKGIFIARQRAGVTGGGDALAS